MKNGTRPADSQERNALYVDSRLDDYGLTAAQFRVLAHIARRGDCWSSRKTFASTCQLNRDTVNSCLKFLEDRGLISKVKRPGATTVYRQLPLSAWRPGGNERLAEKEGRPVKPAGVAERKGWGVAEKEGRPLAEKEGHEGYLSEVHPIESNPQKGVQIPPFSWNAGQKSRKTKPALFVSEIKLLIDAKREAIRAIRIGNGQSHDHDGWHGTPLAGADKARVEQLKAEIAALTQQLSEVAI